MTTRSELIIGYVDGCIEAVLPDTNTPLQTFKAHGFFVNPMIYDEPSDVVVTGGSDSARAWSTLPSEPVSTLPLPEGAHVSALAWVGGRLPVAVGDSIGNVRLWDPVEGSDCLPTTLPDNAAFRADQTSRTVLEAAPADQHDGIVESLVPCGDCLVSSSNDCYLHVYDVASMVRTQHLRVCARAGFVAVRAGRGVVTGDHDGNLKLWSLDPSDEPTSLVDAVGAKWEAIQGLASDGDLVIATVMRGFPVEGNSDPEACRYETYIQLWGP